MKNFIILTTLLATVYSTAQDSIYKQFLSPIFTPVATVCSNKHFLIGTALGFVGFGCYDFGSFLKAKADIVTDSAGIINQQNSFPGVPDAAKVCKSPNDLQIMDTVKKRNETKNKFNFYATGCRTFAYALFGTPFIYAAYVAYGRKQ